MGGTLHSTWRPGRWIRPALGGRSVSASVGANPTSGSAPESPAPPRGATALARDTMARLPPSDEILDRVRLALSDGVSVSEIARQERVDVSTVRRWSKMLGGTPTEVSRNAAPAAHRDLVRRVARLATVLDTAGLVEEAAVAREAADALDVAQAQAPSGDAELPDPAEGALAYMRSLARLIESDIQRSRVVGDGKLAQLIATLGKLMPQIKALELQERSGGDAVVIPRSEITAALGRWRERVASILRDPPRCADCGKAVRQAAATEIYERSKG